MRETILFYRSFYEAIETFKGVKRKLRLYEAFINYALDKKEPTNLSGSEKGLFILFKFIQDKYAIRDNFTCQICGKKSIETQLHAHHIKMFAYNEDERFNLDNGITLCQECHKKIHSQEYKQCKN